MIQTLGVPTKKMQINVCYWRRL